MKEVAGTSNRPEVAEKFSDDAWQAVDVRRRFGPLTPDQSAVFRTHFSATQSDLSAAAIIIRFGMIDDEGWVYVNGQLAGEAHDWSASHSFDIRKFLHPGENSIAVVVKNNKGQGGVNQGVQIEILDPPIAAKWKRSVFNGLGQVLVQSSKNAGELKFTARSGDLSAATVTIQAKPCTPRPAIP
jgi:beta-galactosidase